MSANYDKSFWFYDRLSRMVYGRALVNAQVYLLRYIPVNACILIVGGGTGWILEELIKIHDAGLQITYVEVSANMIALSKKRNIGKNRIVFINDAVENVSLPTGFDIVLTPFLFDNFTEQTCEKVFSHIDSLLKPAGKWLYCDFQLTGKWWQGVLLKSMLLFFKTLCNVEASQLPGVEENFEMHGYKVMAQQTFFNEFVISRVCTKMWNKD
jgi:ubiquinone/menaquinone biosynthesis C-methylase UbiE